MRNRHTIPLLALGLSVLAASPAAAQSVNDFQLPPNPTPTPTPRAQGPVDDSGAVPVPPRPIPTAVPTAAPTSAPTATPAPTSTPRAVLSPSPSVRPAETPATRPVERAPADRSDPSIPLGTAATPTGSATLPESPARSAAPGLPSAANPGAAGGAEVPASGVTLPGWWWMAALGLALAALAGGLLLRRRAKAAVAPPAIVRPVVRGDSEREPDEDLLRYLKVEVDAVRLTRSMMAATLSYRLTLSNRAPEAIRHITLEGDLTSAHGAAPISEQLADSLTTLPSLHQLDHLGAGQRKSFTGEIRLPLKDVRPIRQGKVPIYVPLVRLKASATGAEAKAFTFVVGKAPPMAGARLQPFRLDSPPQTFNEIAARPLG